jgi:gamma-glutamyltranspeptidase/glutathione hydrolase
MIGEKFRVAIAAGSTKTVGAGIEMFRLGGNAFDAAAAAILASFVAEAGLTSAAGGGFLLAPGEAKYFV